jgi:hypothetical protein
LADDGRDGDSDWTIEKQADRATPRTNPALDPLLPTLEDMLTAWSRDQGRFREIRRRVSDYLPAVLEQSDQEDPKAAEMLRRFETLWSKLLIGLGEERKGMRR